MKVWAYTQLGVETIEFDVGNNRQHKLHGFQHKEVPDEVWNRFHKATVELRRAKAALAKFFPESGQ